MADAPFGGRKARTRVAGDFAPKKEHVPKTKPTSLDGPTLLDAEAFTHGGVLKAKFAPKVPQRRVKKSATVKKENGENAEAELSSELQKLVKEDPGRRGRGLDKKVAPTQVAFGYGASGNYGKVAPGFSRCGGGGGGGGGRGGGGGNSFRGRDKKPSNYDGMHEGFLPDDKTGKQPKEYVDPLDNDTYYPVTLPMRKPYSGKSELLDAEEFGEGSANTFDEETIVPAQELSLWNESEEDKIFFFQLPASLPLGRLPNVKSENPVGTITIAKSKTNQADDKGASSSVAQSSSNKEDSILEKLPAGFVGKLLVYESGAVEMRLGETLLNAVPGSECIFVQDVAAINSVGKQYCFLGDISKRVILVPDVDSLLDNTVEIG